MGQVFRRCGKCNRRIKARARRCPCGHPNFSWYYVVDVLRGSERKQAYKGGFPTRETAERALNETLKSLGADEYVKPSTETLEQFLIERWLPAMRPPKLEATTWVEYGRKVRNQIVPRIGHLRIQKIRPLHLNGLYADLLATGRVDGRGGLSPKTVRECHVILHKALGDAVRWGFVQRSIAVLADPPSNRMASVARRASMVTWTAAELRTFLEHVRRDRLFGVWMFTANSGMRRREVGGGRWADLSFDTARFAVRQRLASVDGVPQLSVPKSDRSRRTIDLDPRTLEALKLHHEQQVEERKRWGDGYHDLDLIAFVLPGLQGDAADDLADFVLGPSEAEPPDEPDDPDEADTDGTL